MRRVFLLVMVCCGCTRIVEVGADAPVPDAGLDAGSDAGVEMALVSDGPSGPFLIDRYEANVVGALGSLDQDLDRDGKIADCRAAQMHSASHALLCDDNGGEESVVLTTGVAQSAAGVLPTSPVSFYQAVSACANAGKRLCTATEWSWACKGGSLFNRFPYGNTFDGAQKVGRDCWAANLSTSPSITATASACVTPSGIFDLSGNLREWTDQQLRGGAFNDPAEPQRLDCGATSPLALSVGYTDSGFRCCRSP